MAKQHKESFVRWQGISIQQLGYSINLILAFAAAALGFAFNLLKDPCFPTFCWSKTLFSSSLLLIGISVMLGLLCTVNRLCDFRKTTRIARCREQYCRDGKPETEIDSLLDEHRKETKRLGERTWNLFYGQVAAFGLGMLFLLVSLAIVYRTKLF
jgi:hypothetical protein